MKKYIIVLTCFILALSAQAQITHWGLRDCINYAIANNIDIKRQELNVKKAEIDLNSSKNSRLPNLNGNVSQNFNFGRSPSPSTGIYEENKSSNTAFGVQTNIPIFTGFRIPNQVKKDKWSLKAATEGLNKAKDNLELQITTYYLDVLFKNEILKVYIDEAKLTKTQVDKTNILVNAGKVPLSQLYDIKAQYAKDESNVTNANNDLTNSLLILSQAINLDPNYDLNLLYPDIKIDSIPLDNSASLQMTPMEIYEKALEVKPHIKEAVYKLRSSTYALKVAKSAYYPTLDFNASYNNGFNHIYGKEKINTGISSQLKNNYRALVGLSLNIPIFNRFTTRNNVRAAKLDILDQNLMIENTKLALYKEIQQAYQNALAAKAKYNSSLQAFKAAEESFKYASIRYEIGKISVFEYAEALTKLTNNKSEQIQAKYDFVFRDKILDFYQGKEIDI